MDMEQSVLLYGTIICTGGLIVSLILKFVVIPKVSDILNELEKGNGPHPESGRNSEL